MSRSEEEMRMAFRIESQGFKQGEPIPAKYTCTGQDVSPPLRWADPPAGTKCFALICDDPDAPMMTWVHWAIYNIPLGKNELAENVPAQRALDDGTFQGTNSWRKIGYGGPCPPRGKPHRYFFKMYALDSKLDIGPGADKKSLLRAMEGHVLGRAELMGTYGKP
jgi:hypothetical protein